MIILARGGGVVEDLLPFSDEALCRAVFACRTPVVTAIGHETDTPLVDFVADVRASTPTDAAKRVVPDLAEEVRLIGQARSPAGAGGATLVDRESHRLSAAFPAVLARPQVMVEQRAAEVTALRDRAGRSLDHRLDAATTTCGTPWPGCGRSPPPPPSTGGTRSCSARTATWSGRPARWPRATRCGYASPTASWPRSVGGRRGRARGGMR